MGGIVARPESSPKKTGLPESKLEAKMVEAMQHREAAAAPAIIRSFNSILLKFPKIDENLRKCKSIFQQFDEDSNDAIDHEEMRKCFHKLEISFTEEEINDLFYECDLNADSGISFNEFIVLLCLAYLLKDDPSKHWSKLRMWMPDLEATFETLVNAFVFLDKNKDGYVSKTEMIQAVNDSGEQASGQIVMKRFEEMDWDKNGMVNFKEFMFAFTHWVGIEEDENDDVEG